MEKPESKHAIRSARTREALVSAARELFGARGFAAVGTEEVVRAAGVTRGALYHQFADKAALFEAVLEAVEVDLTRLLAEGALAGGATDPVGALRAGAAAFLDACAEPEVERILLLDAPSVLGWQRWREIGMRHGLGLVLGVLQAAVESGALRDQPLVPLAHVMIGALDEAALYAARAADPGAARREVGEAVDELILALLRGAAADRPGAPPPPPA